MDQLQTQKSRNYKRIKSFELFLRKVHSGLSGELNPFMSIIRIEHQTDEGNRSECQ